MDGKVTHTNHRYFMPLLFRLSSLNGVSGILFPKRTTVMYIGFFIPPGILPGGCASATLTHILLLLPPWRERVGVRGACSAYHSRNPRSTIKRSDPSPYRPNAPSLSSTSETHTAYSYQHRLSELHLQDLLHARPPSGHSSL